MIVHIEELKELQAKIDHINCCPFHMIEWYENNQKVEIPQHIIDSWYFVGMTNCSFISTSFYKEPVLI